MNFLISANTDIGITKSRNQDSLSVKVINTPQGRMVFAILCDGMGGLEKGEVASASVLCAFDNWVKNELPVLCNESIEDSVLREQWSRIIIEQNNIIKSFGIRRGIKLGTTVVVILITQTRYYIMNVGDSRVYELVDNIRQITIDQTLVAREVLLGNMTEEQAHVDARRNVLLQCVGASGEVYPDMFFGDIREDAVYMLCSDGFRHEILPDEIYKKLQPKVLYDDNTMSKHAKELIELNKMRMERDNISVILIKTLRGGDKHA